MENKLVKSVGLLLKNSNRVLIISHIRPDGDAVSSVLALGVGLKQMGKQVQMVLKDGVSQIFQYLPEWQSIEKKVLGEFDLTVAVDCSDVERTGGILQERGFDLNIDHHITNNNFARVNFVDPKAVATAAVLAEWMKPWGIEITQPIAELLLNGILVDTIGFRTSNMTPKALRTAADLMEKGVDLPLLYANALMRRPFEAAKYWGHGLMNLQREDRLVWTTLSISQRADAQYPGTDDADLNNILSTIDDCDISVLFIEQKHDKVKVSWRAQNGYDVSILALSFGGGGHKAAAGAEISGTLDEVKQKVLKATSDLMKQNPENGQKLRKGKE
jgi:bifunctional oligoribonuclease and PAP phosphatase NrnA